MENNYFKPLSIDELSNILGLTIKKDNENKIVTFLCELSAYTDDSQFNISYNAPSSTGKSYIPTEIATLFPEEDTIQLSYSSPTAFWHDAQWDEEKQLHIIDLSRKILIFLDMPHNDLLTRLRPLLSHDKKVLKLKITDRAKSVGLRTKNIILIGFPAVIFCTASSHIDEQEATRFFLLSPEINQEKINQAISQKIDRESDRNKFKMWLDELPERKLLQERILAIKEANVTDIKIKGSEEIKRRFFSENRMLKPRHSRDIGRLLALVKALALLNLWWREKDGTAITANEEDVEQAFQIWNKISLTQDLNLPPYIYNMYKDVILTIWDTKEISRYSLEGEKEGISRQEVQKKHFSVYGRMLDPTKLVKEIIPMLETAGLITQESDPEDSRKMLILPTTPSNNSKAETMGNERDNLWDRA